MIKQNREMRAKNIIAKKNKGQIFLINSYFINLIVNSILNLSKKNVLEIGPGMGALTKVILKKANKLVCVEIDKTLVKYLSLKFKYKNLIIIQSDILNIDLEKLFLKEFLDSNKISIISNIPYYITSSIIFKLLKIKNSKVTEIILMMQKEIGERIMAKPNSKKYNSLSVVCQFYSYIEKICLVKRNNFIPVPKVDSIVLKFKFKKKYSSSINDEKFINFIRMMFLTKRKTILNNLANLIKNKNLAKNILTKSNYPLNLRSENLSLNDFYILYINLNKLTINYNN